MKTLIITLLLSVSTLSFAGTINCFFTEPFIGTSLDSEKTLLEIGSFDGEPVQHLIELAYETNDTIVVATEEHSLAIFKKIKGNDGMSDIVYDYEGIITGVTGGKLYGGCNEVK